MFQSSIGFSLLLMAPIWSAVSYNPLSIKQPERLAHIIREFQWHSVIALQGTARGTDLECEQYSVGTHMVFEWGKRSQDKAAGVLLAIRRKLFTPRNVVRVFLPPKAYQGRVGAVRLKRGDIDICPITVYIPVEPHTQHAKSYNERLWTWISDFISKLPGRCIPLLLMDANGRLGSIADDAVGDADAQRENFNGRLMRATLGAQHMFAVNTFHAAGNTFLPESRVDYICLPQF